MSDESMDKVIARRKRESQKWIGFVALELGAFIGLLTGRLESEHYHTMACGLYLFFCGANVWQKSIYNKQSADS